MSAQNPPTGSLWPELLANRAQRVEGAAGSIRMVAKTAANDPALELGSVSESFSSLLVLAGCDGARAVVQPLIDLIDAAITGMPSMHLQSPSLHGVDLLSFLNEAECCGYAEGSLARAPAAKWLEKLAQRPAQLDENQRRTAAFAALALGEAGLVRRFIGPPVQRRPFQPAQTFLFDQPSLLHYLVAARDAKASAKDVEPAWTDYVRTFPHNLASERASWSDLLWGARIYYHDFEERPAGEAAEALRALVQTL